MNSSSRSRSSYVLLRYFTRTNPARRTCENHSGALRRGAYQCFRLGCCGDGCAKRGAYEWWDFLALCASSKRTTAKGKDGLSMVIWVSIARVESLWWSEFMARVFKADSTDSMTFLKIKLLKQQPWMSLECDQCTNQSFTVTDWALIIINRQSFVKAWSFGWSRHSQ